MALPDRPAPACSELDGRIDAQRKQLDELLRRFTDQHPDVVATRKLISQLEEQRKEEIDARRNAAPESPAKLSASNNPVFQRLKIALAEAEANIASCGRAPLKRTRVAELRAIANKAPEIEAELTQLDRDYDVMRKNYEQLVSRRESASMSGDVDSAGLAEFRIIDPPRISPNQCFPTDSCSFRRFCWQRSVRVWRQVSPWHRSSPRFTQ